jgi:hypothetical protein
VFILGPLDVLIDVAIQIHIKLALLHAGEELALLFVNFVIAGHRRDGTS